MINVKKISLLLMLTLIIGISVTFANPADDSNNTKSPQKILMVVTNWDHLGNGRKTGVWLEEFAVPYSNFSKVGYEVTVASPLGGASPIDPGSMKANTSGKWDREVELLQSTVKLSEVDYKQYAAVVIPGGHGPLFDLAYDSQLAAILQYFDAHNQVIASVCHGPASFVSATTMDGKPLVAGRKLTSFTDKEEQIARSDQAVPFALETKLRALGADFEPGDPWTEHIVVDGNLITGQNPQSSDSMSKAVIKVLADK